MTDAERFGDGQVSANRSVTIVARLQYPGKKPFRLYSEAVVDASLSTKSVSEQLDVPVQAMVGGFVSDHLPDGTDIPSVIEYQLGSLKWIPEDDFWHRPRGS